MLSAVQDFFDSRLLKMDTDFRMFSSQHHGNLPGIDIAYIMDGAAYHTNQDTVERIRKGTVQVPLPVGRANGVIDPHLAGACASGLICAGLGRQSHWHDC